VYKRFPLKIRIKLLVFHRYTGGKKGYGIRYALIKAIAKECGDNVFIGEGVFLMNPQNLKLGSNISIHPMSYLECGNNKDNYIIIGNNVSIAHGVTIIATSHTYISEKTDIIRDMKLKYAPIHICDNVWIGAKATVLLGVTIESGCVIGANSLINRDCKQDGIYAGCPASMVKSRFS